VDVRHGRGIQYVEHTEGEGREIFQAICKLGLEGIVSKKLDAPYRSSPSRVWIKVKNPQAPAATRVIDGLGVSISFDVDDTCSEQNNKNNQSDENCAEVWLH
jgi:hypothetical protein